MAMAKKIEGSTLPLFWEIVDLKGEWRLSELFAYSGMTDSHLFRAHRRARRVAGHIVGDGGGIEKRRITALLTSLKENLYGPYPDQEIDGEIQEHLLSMLKFLETEGANQLKRLSYHGSYTADLIRESLQIFEEKYPSKRQLVLAVVSALLTPLRQSLGSCFATAPAILIQREQPMQLLFDLVELTGTQKLVRVVQGYDQSVPISPSVGLGDLLRPIQVDLSTFSSPALRAAFSRIGIEKLPFYDEYYKAKTPMQLIEMMLNQQLDVRGADFSVKRRAVLSAFRSFTHHALLKAWEYTIASFSESKTASHKWSLSASLGFDPKEKGGVGELMFSEIDTQLEGANKKLQEIQGDYERAYSRVQMGESLLKQADSMQRLNQRKAELSSYMGEFYSLQGMRDRHQREAEHLSKLFPFLVDTYTGRLEEEFQEVYDPEMGEFRSHLHEDSPAGFRLAYKHGRADPNTWTFIRNAEEYQNSLRDFFLRVESEMRGQVEEDKSRDFITELTGRITRNIAEPEFVPGAMKRVENLHQKVRSAGGGTRHSLTPWNYISGGTMKGLIQCYFGLEVEPKEESRRITSPTDLLTFYLDGLKGLSWKTLEKFAHNPKLGLLAFSPVHAFSLRPGLMPFREGWLSERFTYTWVRDEIIGKARDFYSKNLSWDEQQILIDILMREEFPGIIKSQELPKLSRSISTFRDEVAGIFSTPHSRQLLFDGIDSVIRRSLPFQNGKPFYRYLREKQLTKKELFSAKLEKEKGPPEAILFADSNWSYYYLGFIYNPGTDSLELWRIDRSGLFGYPMSSWIAHLTEACEKPWGFLTEPVRHGPILPEWFSYRV